MRFYATILELQVHNGCNLYCGKGGIGQDPATGVKATSSVGNLVIMSMNVY